MESVSFSLCWGCDYHWPFKSASRRQLDIKFRSQWRGQTKLWFEIIGINVLLNVTSLDKITQRDLFRVESFKSLYNQHCYFPLFTLILKMKLFLIFSILAFKWKYSSICFLSFCNHPNYIYPSRSTSRLKISFYISLPWAPIPRQALLPVNVPRTFSVPTLSIWP